MKHISLFLALLIYPAICLHCQDQIVRINKQKIDCKIISITNDEILFSLNVKGHYAETSIAQNEVIKLIIADDLIPVIASDLNEENQRKINYRERKVLSLRKLMPHHGFFIEAGYTNLFINGNGTVYEEPFDITADWFKMYVIETESQIDLTVYYFDGFGLKNRTFGGFRPLIGYRFSPKLTFTLSYSHYFKQESEQSETYTTTHFSYATFTAHSSLLYTQRGLQLLFNYTPKSYTGFYLSAGVEFMRLKLKADDKLSVTPPSYPDFENVSRTINGSDLSAGIVIGAGNELPLFSSKLILNSSILYSFNKYSDNDLFQEEKPGPIFDPRLPAAIKIGGVIFNISLRKYF